MLVLVSDSARALPSNYAFTSTQRSSTQHRLHFSRKFHQRSWSPRPWQRPLLRQASLSLRYLTVTYGEWYVFSRRLLPRRQDVTDVTCVRLPCLVYIIIVHGSFHSRFSHIFFKVLRDRFKLNLNYFSNGHRFFNCSMPLTRVAHSSKMFTSGFNSNLNPWRETAITTPLNHLNVLTKSVCCVLSTYPLHHVPLVAWSSPVWCYQIAGQYTPVWRQQFKGQSYNWAKHISVALIVGGLALC